MKGTKETLTVFARLLSLLNKSDNTKKELQCKFNCFKVLSGLNK